MPNVQTQLCVWNVCSARHHRASCLFARRRRTLNPCAGCNAGFTVHRTTSGVVQAGERSAGRHACGAPAPSFALRHRSPLHYTGSFPGIVLPLSSRYTGGHLSTAPVISCALYCGGLAETLCPLGRARRCGRDRIGGWRVSYFLLLNGRRQTRPPVPLDSSLSVLFLPLLGDLLSPLPRPS